MKFELGLKLKKKKRIYLRNKLVKLVDENEIKPSLALDKKIEKLSNDLQQLNIEIDKLEK